MPAVSKQQFKFMKAVESGKAKAKGLSKAKAAEFTAGQSPKGLPKRKGETEDEMGLSHMMPAKHKKMKGK